MSEFRNDSYVSSRPEVLVKSYMTKVYGFMALALFLTAAVAYMGYQSFRYCLFCLKCIPSIRRSFIRLFYLAVWRWWELLRVLIYQKSAVF